MIGNLFAAFKKEPEPQEEKDSLPKAFAALLIEAARADEEYTDEERVMIDRMLAAKFTLDRDAARTLRIEAETDQAQANDLYGFSSVVRDELDHAGKLSLIEDMWRIVLSDDDRGPHEEMTIRRLVGLIHLEDRDSQLIRQKIERGG